MKDKKNLYYIGGAIIAYFFVLKPIFEKLGITKTKEEIDRDKAKEKFLLSTGQKPTKSEGEWAIIADQIHEDLRYTALDDDKTDAAYQAARVKNNADLKLLYKNFGKRQEYFFGVPSGSEKDLQQFLRSNLSDSQIQIINQNYRNKNISFQY
jgi:hypothetical protein